MDKDNESKHPGGRPKAVDWKENEPILFGRFRATHQTMADYYGVCSKTIDRIMQDEDHEFCLAYKKSLTKTKMTLFESQLHTATVDRNPTLLVWLGKQLLDQKDKQEIDHTSGGKPIQPRITFSE